MEKDQKKMSKQEILDEAYRRGYKYEQDYRDCAQCTLLAIEEIFNIKGADAVKAATGFAGGIGRSGSVCGGFTGGVMALGMLYGRDVATMKQADAEKRAEQFRNIEARMGDLVKKLSERFKAEYGTTICDQIEAKLFGRSFDKWNPEDRKEKDRLGGHQDKCPSVVGNATRWVAEIILAEREKE